MSDLNDPRVFFAAERTLLAWTRTALTLMAFGFVIERFGLFLHMFMAVEGKEWQRDASFWLGICFILLGAVVGVLSVVQYRHVIKTLKPIEIPGGILGQYGCLRQFTRRYGWRGDHLLLYVRTVMKGRPVVPLMMYHVGLTLEVLGIFLGITSLGVEATTETTGALFVAGAALFVAGYLIVRASR